MWKENLGTKMPSKSFMRNIMNLLSYSFSNPFKWDSNCTKQLILCIKFQLNSSEIQDNCIVTEQP